MSAFTEARMHLAVEIDGGGRHPGAARPAGDRSFGPSSPAGLVRAAAARGLDLVVLGASDADAARRIAPVVPGIGLVPRLPVAGVDPDALVGGLAALQRAAAGRAGWELELPAGAADLPWRLAGEVLDAVARRWEPGASPLVVVRADGPVALALAARHADVVRVAAPDLAAARAARDRVHDAVRAAGRPADTVRVLLDVEVHLAASRAGARSGLRDLDARAGRAPAPSSVRVVGTPADLADVVEGAVRLGAADGVVLVPLALPGDLLAVTAEVVPLLAARGLYRTGRAGVGLRARLGLPGPAAARAAS